MLMSTERLIDISRRRMFLRPRFCQGHVGNIYYGGNISINNKFSQTFHFNVFLSDGSDVKERPYLFVSFSLSFRLFIRRLNIWTYVLTKDLARISTHFSITCFLIIMESLWLLKFLAKPSQVKFIKSLFCK